MDIIGKSDRAVDRVNADERLVVTDLMKLVERLAATVSGEQFFFREIELDCAFREADMAYARAARSGSAEEITYATGVRALVFQAHDLVGIRDIDKATETLHTLMDVLIELRPRDKAGPVGDVTQERPPAS